MKVSEYLPLSTNDTRALTSIWPGLDVRLSAHCGEAMYDACCAGMLQGSRVEPSLPGQ
jgi:hypothetical protein